MPNLFVSYDLFRPQQNYPAVEKAIKELGPAVKVLLSVWYVATRYTMEQARDHVARAIDPNDKLLVIDARNACGTNIGNSWEGVRRTWINTSG